MTEEVSAARSVTTISTLGLAATILITWPLWAYRDAPPTLPAVAGLAGLDLRPWLVVATVAALLRPRIAAPALVGVLVVGVLGDQTRLQPEVLSLAFLAVVGDRWPSLARWHLATMWLWAGAHKVLSLGWTTGGAAYIAQAHEVPGARVAVAWLVPAAEITVGVLALRRRWWPVLRWAAPALHLGILLTLVRDGWNEAVWPWNAALAAVAPLLFVADAPRAAAPTTRALAAGLATFPALFYLGWVDAYPAHNLYTSNTATAVVCDAGPVPRCSAALFDTFDELEVPMPPEPRLYRATFDRTCQPGSTLVVTGRATRLTDPPTVTRRACPAR